MTVFITNLNAEGLAYTIAQHTTAQLAKQLGYSEISIRQYHKNDETSAELSARFDGTLAGFKNGDTLIFQSPTWISTKFDKLLIKRVRRYKNAKIIIFVHDVIALMFESNRYLLSPLIEMYNSADEIIVASENMRKFLINNGLTIPKVLIQEVWDHLYDAPAELQPGFKKSISFIGNPEKFTFAESWQYDSLRLRLYASAPATPNPNIDYIGRLPDATLMPTLQANGGFGLVWGSDRYWHEYMHLNTSYKLGTYLSAGLPVIIDQSNSNVELVKNNHLGIVVSSLDEAVARVMSMSVDEYTQLQTAVERFAPLLRQGFFTKKVLTDAVFYLMQDSKVTKNHGLKNSQPEDFKVYDIDQTLDYVLDNHASVARFGSGEFNLLSGISIPYQDFDEELAFRLRNIIAIKSNPKFVVGLPDVFNGLDQYTVNAKNFWKHFLTQKRDMLSSITTEAWYGSAFVSRPYMDLADKSKAKHYFQKLKKLWNQRDILIVEGKSTRAGIGNDLFDNANSITRIIGPSKNAFTKLNAIEKAILKYGKDKLVLLMLGPTAKVIAYDMSQQGLWTVDIGHIDSEYEWYKLQATKKIQLPHKHTAEFNNLNDADLALQDTKEYLEQVVADLSNK